MIGDFDDSFSVGWRFFIYLFILLSALGAGYIKAFLGDCTNYTLSITVCLKKSWEQDNMRQVKRPNKPESLGSPGLCSQYSAYSAC